MGGITRSNVNEKTVRSQKMMNGRAGFTLEERVSPDLAGKPFWKVVSNSQENMIGVQLANPTYHRSINQAASWSSILTDINQLKSCAARWSDPVLSPEFNGSFLIAGTRLGATGFYSYKQTPPSLGDNPITQIDESSGQFAAVGCESAAWSPFGDLFCIPCNASGTDTSFRVYVGSNPSNPTRLTLSGLALGESASKVLGLYDEDMLSIVPSTTALFIFGTTIQKIFKLRLRYGTWEFKQITNPVAGQILAFAQFGPIVIGVGPARGGPIATMIRSTDYGESFQEVTGIPITTNSNVVWFYNGKFFVGCDRSGTTVLIESKDYGKTWIASTNQPFGNNPLTGLNSACICGRYSYVFVSRNVGPTENRCFRFFLPGVI